MSRSKQDILNTEAMLKRLAGAGISRDDAEALRRISMTLHRWHELECGDGNNHGSWSIVRGAAIRLKDAATGEYMNSFNHDEDGAPYIERHHYLHGRGKDYVTYTRIPDRGAGARRRLAKIMARYPLLIAYVQTDPRGCALYVLRRGDVPEGADVSAYYSRGIAVYK